MKKEDFNNNLSLFFFFLPIIEYTPCLTLYPVVYRPYFNSVHTPRDDKEQRFNIVDQDKALKPAAQRDPREAVLKRTRPIFFFFFRPCFLDS